MRGRERALRHVAAMVRMAEALDVVATHDSIDRHMGGYPKASSGNGQVGGRGAGGHSDPTGALAGRPLGDQAWADFCGAVRAAHRMLDEALAIQRGNVERSASGAERELSEDNDDDWCAVFRTVGRWVPAQRTTDLDGVLRRRLSKPRPLSGWVIGFAELTEALPTPSMMRRAAAGQRQRVRLRSGELVQIPPA